MGVLYSVSLTEIYMKYFQNCNISILKSKFFFLNGNIMYVCIFLLFVCLNIYIHIYNASNCVYIKWSSSSLRLNLMSKFVYTIIIKDKKINIIDGETTTTKNVIYGLMRP